MNAPSLPSTAVLICHSATPSVVIRGIEVRVDRRRGGALALAYTLNGNIARLRIPSPRPPRRADRLWEHTCLETFVAAKDRPSYYEFNFSPSGEWAAYGFRGYRDGGPMEGDELDPNIVARRDADTLELSAAIRLNRLPSIERGGSLVLGLAAVIEELEGRLSYWALYHPPGKPDFHHADAFALQLPPPGYRR